MSTNIIQQSQINDTILKSPSIEIANKKVQKENGKLIKKDVLQTEISNLKSKITNKQKGLEDLLQCSYNQTKAVHLLKLLFVFLLCLLGVYIGKLKGFFTTKNTLYICSGILVFTFIFFIVINTDKKTQG